jgi:hypothetical protein
MDVWDPEKLEIHAVALPYGSLSVFELRAIPAFVPRYVDLQCVDDRNLRTRYLLASAALPYGVVSEVLADGTCYLDGSVADILPIHPLIEFEQCDIILVIRLRPECEDEGAVEVVERHWQQVARLTRAAELTRADVTKTDPRGDDSIKPAALDLVRVDTTRFRADAVRVVGPSKGLGSKITGMLHFNLVLPSSVSRILNRWMSLERTTRLLEWLGAKNFDGTYTRRLIDQGRADARSKSPEFWITLGGSAEPLDPPK